MMRASINEEYLHAIVSLPTSPCYVLCLCGMMTELNCDRKIHLSCSEIETLITAKSDWLCKSKDSRSLIHTINP